MLCDQNACQLRQDGGYPCVFGVNLPTPRNARWDHHLRNAQGRLCKWPLSTMTQSLLARNRAATLPSVPSSSAQCSQTPCAPQCARPGCSTRHPHPTWQWQRTGCSSCARCMALPALPSSGAGSGPQQLREGDSAHASSSGSGNGAGQAASVSQIIADVLNEQSASRRQSAVRAGQGRTARGSRVGQGREGSRTGRPTGFELAERGFRSASGQGRAGQQCGCQCRAAGQVFRRGEKQ